MRMSAKDTGDDRSRDIATSLIAKTTHVYIIHIYIYIYIYASRP